MIKTVYFNTQKLYIQVVFLQSMLGSSRVVLFDEPTSGLDPESRRVLWNVMLALFTGGPNQVNPSNLGNSGPSRSCVLTTHSLEEAEALCSRIAILLKGQIIAIGLYIRFFIFKLFLVYSIQEESMRIRTNFILLY